MASKPNAPSSAPAASARPGASARAGDFAPAPGSTVGHSADSHVSIERLVDFRKIWAIVWKNWLVLKGDKARLIPLMIFPLIMLVIFGYSTGNVPKNLPAAVVDYDSSNFSHSLVTQLSALQTFSIQYHVSNQQEGKMLMDEGKIKILFIIPPGLGEDVAANRPAQMQIMVDESDSSVAQITKTTTAAFVQKVSDQLAADHLGDIQGLVRSAQSQVGQARATLSSVAENASSPASPAAVSATWRDYARVSAATSAELTDSITAQRNSLGFLIDQNSVIGSFSPSSQGQAALTELATGDSQQAVLQQIAADQGLLAGNRILASDAGKLYSAVQYLQAQEAARAQVSDFSVKVLDSAGRTLQAAGESTPSGDGSPFSLTFVEPYGYGRQAIDFLLPSILALIIFQGASTGLGRAVAGERRDGSLTRVFLTPTSNVTIIMGTQLFYLILETVRSSFVIFVAIALFGVTISGSVTDIIFIIAIYALGATGIGMVLSVLTKTEDQYMAIAMLISLPMMFLSGAFFPIQTMPPALQSMAGVLPVTYAADALRGVMVKGFTLGQVFPDLLALSIFGAATFYLTVMFFKRELV
ncbi:MAG: ABC-2 transporter permease [Candidatus Micrarchaeota archaeon]|nr:ABC-2 transporter permease [Candidatus Micrarchaeota archaeon]